ncbi:MAG: ABC transporter substrate-binding protein [Caulobacteraceae bacterium]
MTQSTHSFLRPSGLIGAVAALLLSLQPLGALAAAADPAAARIEVLDQALLETMKAGPILGVKGRYRKLEPVIAASFDLPTMTRFAVGPTWASMSETDRQALVKAFTRLSTASYAHNFDRYGGERFSVDPAVVTRGVDKIVQTHLIPARGAPVALSYRMRDVGGAWKIIDVNYGAISQLTTRRADFAQPLAIGGAKGLLAHLDALSDKLLRS